MNCSNYVISKIKILGFLFFLFAPCVTAKLLLLSLPEMVEKAEIIAIGSVSNIQATTNASSEFHLSKATLQFQTVIKGIPTLDGTEVFFSPNIEDEPQFVVGDRSIFFIHKLKDRNVLVQGHAGKIDIRGNDVINIRIMDEPISQSMKGFMGKIQNILEESGPAKDE